MIRAPPPSRSSPTLPAELEFTQGPLKIHIRNKYLADQSCLETTYDFTKNGHTDTRRNWHFVFTAAEIGRMLSAAGLTPIALYGSPTRQTYVLGSRWLYIVAAK